MPDYRTIDKSYENLFDSVLQRVQGQLEIKKKTSTVGLKLLRQFDELNKYQSLFVHKVTELKGTKNSLIILLIEKHLTIIESKRSGRFEKTIEEIEPVLVFSISQNIGRVLIKKETLADKVADLVNKIDIDFNEYPAFSKNYYVVGNRPDLVKKYLPKALIESLEKVKNLTVEINGNWGLLRSEKNLTEDLLMMLISIGHKLAT